MTSRPELSVEARELLDGSPSRGPRRSRTLEENRAGLREAAAQAFGETVPVAGVVDLQVDGSPTVPVRLYHPAPGTTLPVLVYSHGGGWVLGDLETHDRLCRALAAGSGCAVVSVDYRRAPEHPFPAAWHDVRTVLAQVAAHPERFGVDASRIALGGDSAGGQLAAATALWARDTGIRVTHVVLLMPDVDTQPEAWASHAEFDERFGLFPDDQIWYYEQYFGPSWRSLEGPGVAPLRSDLRGLPSMTVVLAECDPVRDEGAAFAALLERAGVEVDVREYPGMFHPFILFRGLDAARDAERYVADALRRQLRAP